MLRHPAQNGAPHMASLLCETAPKRRMFVSEADGSAPLLGQKGRADTIAGEAAMKPETKQDEHRSLLLAGLTSAPGQRCSHAYFFRGEEVAACTGTGCFGFRSRTMTGEHGNMKTLFAVVAAALLMSGCSIRHDVAKDYPQYLINNQGTSQLPSTTAASEYTISPATAAHHYEFRSALAGYANVWVVQFGEVLDDTLQSHDVQTAFGKLMKSSGGSSSDGLLVFDLQNYSYAEFGAHVALKVTYRRGNQDVFSKVYQADGTTQGGKMFWGGAFAMKNAVQQSTKLAIDTILRQLIADLNASPARS
jgi:PBP1b-binding outer membrane lipoprotein LpoB